MKLLQAGLNAAVDHRQEHWRSFLRRMYAQLAFDYIGYPSSSDLGRWQTPLSAILLAFGFVAATLSLQAAPIEILEPLAPSMTIQGLLTMAFLVVASVGVGVFLFREASSHRGLTKRVLRISAMVFGIPALYLGHNLLTHGREVFGDREPTYRHLPPGTRQDVTALVRSGLPVDLSAAPSILVVFSKAFEGQEVTLQLGEAGTHMTMQRVGVITPEAHAFRIRLDEIANASTFRANKRIRFLNSRGETLSVERVWLFHPVVGQVGSTDGVPPSRRPLALAA